MAGAGGPAAVQVGTTAGSSCSSSWLGVDQMETAIRQVDQLDIVPRLCSKGL
jgi:hypothetical protein